MFAKRHSLCESTLWKLIEINPDCKTYIIHLIKIFNFQKKDISSLFDIIQAKSLLASVEMLSLVDMSVFSSKSGSTFQLAMEQRSPAIFQLFKEILKDHSRRNLIWTTLLQMDQKSLHVIIFKAKYLNFVNDKSEALALINSAIVSHPGSSNDLILIKAHIQKNITSPNDINDTVSSIKNSIARDKFSVSKVAKYMIRYGSVFEAQEMIGNFIQKLNLTERMGDLHEMQAVWYLMEMGDRLFKDGNILYSACFYRKIELIFAEFIDDQLDFHGYSLRRMSFVEYVKFMRFLDSDLKNSDILKRSQIGLSRCLIQLNEFSSGAGDVDSLTSKLNSSQISVPFADDISVHVDYFRTILLNQKACIDYLNVICNNLMSNYSENIGALQAALEISLKINTLLTSQKLSMKLLDLGAPISDSIIDQINCQRLSEINSLWQNVPLLN